MAPNVSNVETYTALMETLALLRDTIRRMARQVHGDKWQDAVFVDSVREHLDLRRERESAIQWRLPAFTDLLDFAGFEDLGEIITSESAFLAVFKAVVPDPELLRARLLELEAIQHRVSYGRPVGDVELEFVVSFSERLRRIDLANAKAGATGKPEKSQSSPRKMARPQVEPAPEAEPVAEVELESAEDAGEADLDPAAESAPPPPAPEPPARTTAAAPATRSAKTASERSASISLSDVARALDENKDAIILRGLYNEVTAVAEILWQKGEAVSTPVWEMISEATWYSERFSALGLKPVSDFYVLVNDAAEQSRGGASATAVKEMLQDRRFGEILLALRELFRKHLLTS